MFETLLSEALHALPDLWSLARSGRRRVRKCLFCPKRPVVVLALTCELAGPLCLQQGLIKDREENQIQLRGDVGMFEAVGGSCGN